MDNDISEIHTQLAALQRDVSRLQEGYSIVNKRYAEALASLQELTSNSAEAAKRAATAAAGCVEATRSAAQAAQIAVDHVLRSARSESVV